MRGLKNLIAQAIAIVLCISPLSAQFVFTGIYQEQKVDNQIVQASSWEDLLQQQQNLTAQGFHLTDIEFAGESEQKTYWSVVTKGDVAQSIHKESNWKSMLERHRSKVSEGWVLSDIEGYGDKSGNVQFVGLWQKGTANQQLWKLNSWLGVKKLTADMGKKNIFLQDIEIIKDSAGKLNFLLVYQADISQQRTHLIVHTDAKAYLTDRLERIKSGYGIIDFESIETEEKSFMVSIFKRTAQKEGIRRNMNPEGLSSVSKDMAEKGLQISDLEINLENKPVIAPPTAQKVHNFSPEK